MGVGGTAMAGTERRVGDLARAALGSAEPPAMMFDGEDVDVGEGAPQGTELTLDEVEAILGEATRRGTAASGAEAN